MPVSVSKTFRFEAAHRLPWYEGPCRHVHGHSYAMTVEFTGEPDEHGMVADFNDIKRIVAPLVSEWDHAMIVSVEDQALIDAAEQLGSRYALLPFDSTAENLCAYVSEHILTEGRTFLLDRKITDITVAIRETVTCEARMTRRVE